MKINVWIVKFAPPLEVSGENRFALAVKAFPICAANLPHLTVTA